MVTTIAQSSPRMKLKTHLDNMKIKRSEDDITSLYNLVGQLARQSVLHQLEIEERVRSEGDSGLKQTRHVREGTRPYHSDNHIGWAFAANHDHANYIRTVGLGEIIAVLNGVEFRTRHNDYSLTQASPYTHKWQETYDFPFPWVPWQVTIKESMEQQVEQMQNVFKAWRDQDNSTYEYKDHFKPVLCYMEGFWTVPDDELEDSVDSDRHYLDANSWYELEEKIRFLSYSGSKDPDENLSYLPKIIINVTLEGHPVYAQWNYDILCHPLEEDVPLDRFRVVDDLSGRMRNRQSLKNYKGDDWGDPLFSTVTEGGRNRKPGNAYNGTNGWNFYQTPFEFYNQSDEVGTDPADTTPPGAVSVLDNQGNERMVVATGPRIFFPEIPGVGVLRQRYPIAPVHGEGYSVWKEVAALTELVMNPEQLKWMIYNPIKCDCDNSGGGSEAATEPPSYLYETSPAAAEWQNHVHHFQLNSGEVEDLANEKNVTLDTSQDDGHTHNLKIYAVNGNLDNVKYHLCDNSNQCWDGHDKDLNRK